MRAGERGAPRPSTPFCVRDYWGTSRSAVAPRRAEDLVQKTLTLVFTNVERLEDVARFVPGSSRYPATCGAPRKKAGGRGAAGGRRLEQAGDPSAPGGAKLKTISPTSSAPQRCGRRWRSCRPANASVCSCACATNCRTRRLQRPCSSRFTPCATTSPGEGIAAAAARGGAEGDAQMSFRFDDHEELKRAAAGLPPAGPCPATSVCSISTVACCRRRRRRSP